MTLQPRVTLAPGSDREKALALHHTAHEKCFIARSVNFPVDHAPLVEVAPSREDTLAKKATVETSPGTAEISAESGRSIFQQALRRISGFLNKHRDRDIERFINARGGIINDALDRQLTRHCSRNKGDD